MVFVILYCDRARLKIVSVREGCVWPGGDSRRTWGADDDDDDDESWRVHFFFLDTYVEMKGGDGGYLRCK